MSNYKCYECKTIHTEGNMVAYCASCFSNAKLENAKLREICRDLHWMARRYADGRSTYAPDIVNRAADYLVSIGVKLNECGKEGIYAKQG